MAQRNTVLAAIINTTGINEIPKWKKHTGYWKKQKRKVSHNCHDLTIAGKEGRNESKSSIACAVSRRDCD